MVRPEQVLQCVQARLDTTDAELSRHDQLVAAYEALLPLLQADDPDNGVDLACDEFEIPRSAHSRLLSSEGRLTQLALHCVDLWNSGMLPDIIDRYKQLPAR